MKDIFVLLFSAFTTVVHSKELNSTLRGQLYGKVTGECNRLPSIETVLYSLARVIFSDSFQTGLYAYGTGYVYIQHPIGYTCNPVGIQNVNFTDALVYRSNDGPYKVLNGSPQGTYIFLQLGTQPPDRHPQLKMLLMALVIRSSAGQDAYIAGWNKYNRPEILQVKISHVGNDEIHVDLSSYEVVVGDDYIASNDMKRGDLLIQSSFCVGFFIERQENIGVFSATYLSEYTPVRPKRHRAESSSGVARHIRKITTDVRDLNLEN